MSDPEKEEEFNNEYFLSSISLCMTTDMICVHQCGKNLEKMIHGLITQLLVLLIISSFFYIDSL